MMSAEEAKQIKKNVEEEEENIREDSLRREEEWKKTPMEKRYASGAKSYILKKVLAAIEDIIMPVIQEKSEAKRNFCKVYLFGVPKFYNDRDGEEFHRYLTFDNFSKEEIGELNVYYQHYKIHQGCDGYSWRFRHYSCLRDWMRETFAVLICETLTYNGYGASLEYDHETGGGYYIFSRFALHISW